MIEQAFEGVKRVSERTRAPTRGSTVIARRVRAAVLARRQASDAKASSPVRGLGACGRARRLRGAASGGVTNGGQVTPP